jgi:N-acetylornithine carbamoyltransferase
MKHVTRIADLGPEALERILARAKEWKAGPPPRHLRGKILGMIFFNPSLRTRASFEAVMARGGGRAIIIEAGAGAWKLEDRVGVVMNADCPEHLKEAVPVMSRYVDVLAVRSFSRSISDEDDNADAVLRAFQKYATVPVISMESAREHPCQGLADLMTIEESFTEPKGLPVTLTWAPHIKPLPKAVPNSFLLTAAARGCEVRVAHPPGFELHHEIRAEAEVLAKNAGGKICYFREQDSALIGTRAIYAKAWGPATARELPADSVTRHNDWMITARQMNLAAPEAIFLHCLPVRRNVEVADEVLDGKWSRVIDQAENRFHVQRALLDWLLN